MGSSHGKQNNMTLESKTYWEAYYDTHRNPAKPSFFAEFVAPFLQKNQQLIEIGCGNGRDSVFFAEQGISVKAIDQCTNEIDYLNATFSTNEHILFVEGDMENLPQYNQIDCIYSRFSIHAINHEAETKVLKWALASLKPGGLFFIEARSVKDDLYGQGTEVGKNEFITDHYRRFIDRDEFIEKVSSLGFTVLYNLESKGLAPYKHEDPVVLRIILQKAL